MRKKLKAILAISLVGLALVGCGEKTKETSSTSISSNDSAVIDKIKEKGKLTIGVFTDKPPFGYVDKDGNNEGFEIALSKRFAKDLLGDESKVEFVPVEPASRVPFLQSDKVDLIMANMTVTEERKKVVDFTNPIIKVAIQIMAPDNSSIKSIDDLKGQKVIVTKGTTADIFFTKNHPDIELLKFESVTDSFQALKDGRGVAYVNDNLLLFDIAKKNPGYKIIDTQLEEPSPIAPAVKKGNTELLEWVNKELETLGEDKFLGKLYDEYLKESFGDNVKDPNSVIVEGGKWK